MRSSDEEEEWDCPLCMEEMDLSDRNFKPCPCGYQICRFCWNHIKESLNGRCPACRRIYDDANIEFIPLSNETCVLSDCSLVKMKSKKKAKEKEIKEIDLTARKHLSNLRVLQRNLVYVIGIPARIASEEILQRNEYFGQFGKIQKTVVNKRNLVNPPINGHPPTASVYITYYRKEDAAKVIQYIDGSLFDNRILKATYGTTKYCSFFLRGINCQNPGCMYLHEQGDERDSFTKEEMTTHKHQFHEGDKAENRPLQRLGTLIFDSASSETDLNGDSTKNDFSMSCSDENAASFTLNGESIGSKHFMVDQNANQSAYRTRTPVGNEPVGTCSGDQVYAAVQGQRIYDAGMIGSPFHSQGIDFSYWKPDGRDFIKPDLIQFDPFKDDIFASIRSSSVPKKLPGHDGDHLISRFQFARDPDRRFTDSQINSIHGITSCPEIDSPMKLNSPKSGHKHSLSSSPRIDRRPEEGSVGNLATTGRQAFEIESTLPFGQGYRGCNANPYLENAVAPGHLYGGLQRSMPFQQLDSGLADAASLQNSYSGYTDQYGRSMTLRQPFSFPENYTTDILEDRLSPTAASLSIDHKTSPSRFDTIRRTPSNFASNAFNSKPTSIGQIPVSSCDLKNEATFVDPAIMAARVHSSPKRNSMKLGFPTVDRHNTQTAQSVPSDLTRKVELKEKYNPKNSNTDNDRDYRNLPFKKAAERQKGFNPKSSSPSAATANPSKIANTSDSALPNDRNVTAVAFSTEVKGVSKAQQKKMGSPSVGFVDSNLFNLLHDEDKESVLDREARRSFSSESSLGDAVANGASCASANSSSSSRQGPSDLKSQKNSAKPYQNQGNLGPNAILENFLNHLPAYPSFDSAQIDFTPSTSVPTLPPSLELIASRPEDRNVEKLEKALEEAQRDCEWLESQLMQIMKKNEKIIFS